MHGDRYDLVDLPGAGRTVVLSALRPVVLERHRPRGYLMPHAGVVSPRRYTVLLDTDPPRLKPRADDGPPSRTG
ncbi:hypothetical protein [Streptomyces sp. NPDC004783]|uniref:hypothetical protein n=1 Tax=Streptomyces sp. NPDC004783 TaxID=3154459 RepID=UPI0033A5DA2D